MSVTRHCDTWNRVAGGAEKELENQSLQVENAKATDGGINRGDTELT